MKSRFLKKTLELLVSPLLVGTLIVGTIHLSKPDYSEFVPFKKYYLNNREYKEGYLLIIECNKNIVSGSNSPVHFEYVVDEDGDLNPDYTIEGMNASVRLAGKMKRECNEDEKEVFYDTIRKSKRYGSCE